jgi:hypothetical protein
MQRILFLVHGMGVHGKDWASPVIAQLEGLPAKYGYDWFGQNGAVADHVRFVPITYDDVFKQYLDDWSSSATRLEAFAKAQGVAVPKLLNWLGTASAVENNFFWSHVVDVLLYRLFQIVTAEVRLRVRLAIAEALTPAMAGGMPVDASVLAHSLGTSVTHDSLSLLATQPIKVKKGQSRAFMRDNFSFANVFMLANVSRILETSEKVYDSALHPVSVRSDTAYTSVYCDFRHALDPIPAFKCFQPEGWGDAFLHVAEHQRVLQFNTHSLEHYLEDPRVHVPILQQLTEPEAITAQEYKDAVAQYDATPEPPCAAALNEFRRSAKHLMAEHAGASEPQEIVMAMVKALAAAKEAKDACA